VSEKIDVAVVAKLKQGDLWRAMQERGWTVKDLSRHLGEPPRYEYLCQLLNFVRVPLVLPFDKKQCRKLVELTGKLPEDLWPREVRRRNLKTTQTAYLEVPIKALVGEERIALPAPQMESVLAAEKAKFLMDAVDRLRGREAKVLRLRFVEELTLDEVADRLGLCRERVRQIEARGIFNLRENRKLARQLDGRGKPEKAPMPLDYHRRVQRWIDVSAERQKSDYEGLLQRWERR
jgi:RNA polymerase sigma factor (sigma-70 family)